MSISSMLKTIAARPASTLRPFINATFNTMTPNKPLKIRLTLDFDSTLTTTDTLAPLSSIGYNHPHSISRTPWSSIVSAYLSDLSAHTAKYPYPPSSRTTITAEEAWLASLADIEQASANRAVVEAGIWDGVSRSEVDAAAEQAIRCGEVRFRKGWSEVVEKVLEGQGKIEVCSVNWSRWWIWCCMKHAWTRDVEGRQAEFPLEKVAVFANELPSIMSDHVEDGELPQGKSLQLRTASDKLRCFNSSRESHGASLHGEDATDSSRLLSVYVGDSTSDLLCLLSADIGICMRDERMGSGQKELEATCKRLGVDMSPIETFGWETVQAEETSQAGSNNIRKRLWWTTDFVDINNWVRLVC